MPVFQNVGVNDPNNSSIRTGTFGIENEEVEEEKDPRVAMDW